MKDSNESDLLLETEILSKDELIQLEDIYFNNTWLPENYAYRGEEYNEL